MRRRVRREVIVELIANFKIKLYIQNLLRLWELRSWDLRSESLLRWELSLWGLRSESLLRWDRIRECKCVHNINIFSLPF